ncbi:ABC transporter substrate-binding protein [Pseudomonas cedrina subsp. fulgida]|nr:ABC transporter substrate-binding protein [Pseudomonas cedrina subsp. fulgida]
MHKQHRALLVAVTLGLCTQGAFAAPQVPERLQKVDKLTYCSGMDSPPLVSFDESQKPRGLTVDLGLEIAKRLGNKTVQWRVIPFSGLVPALLAQQCDMIVDQLFDKPERRQVIDIVNYMYSSQSVVVPKGNPKGIKTLEDLSTHKVAVLNGSTIKTLLDTQNESLAKAGKPPMKLVVYNTDTDAFQALRINQVDAYGTTVETAGYYAAMAPDLFQEGVPAFSRILTGLGMRKDDPQLTAAVQQVISDMRSDGSYVQLLNKWHVSSDALD